MSMMLSSLLVMVALVGVLPLPGTASAAAYTKRGNVNTPNGFCTVHADGTKGVRFDSASYTAFLAEHAADKITLAKLVEKAKADAVKNGGAPLTELQIGQLAAKIRKDAATLQRMRIDAGQAVLCK